MTKKEIDVLINNYYKVLNDYASRLIVKFNRNYSSEEVITELYLHLLKNKDKRVNFYSYSKGFIEKQIYYSGSTLNQREGKAKTHELEEVEAVETESTEQRIDTLKAELSKVKCKCKVNQLFLDELISEKDHTRKTIGEHYGITRQAVAVMIGDVAKEVSKQLKSK